MPTPAACGLALPTWFPLDTPYLLPNGGLSPCISSRNSTLREIEEWQPLGVFGLIQEDEKKAQRISQLAVNKDGIIRGNYHDSVDDNTLPVVGSLDRTTQRMRPVTSGQSGELMNLTSIILAATLCTSADPLPSWNEGPAKKSILNFVERVTDKAGKDFVKPSERIAVFDNDGTLWPENPLPFQLAYALDRIKKLAPKHPEWKQKQPFKAVLEDDLPALIASGKEGLLGLILTAHAGHTTDEFDASVRAWLKTARHPRWKRPYTDLTYQPMQEVLRYMRANGFKTFIVSGGGAEFMRVFSEEVYGIPPEQVVGTLVKTKFTFKDGKPVLQRLPELIFIDDKEGKPVGIHQMIGRRPIACFGNSDGDVAMLQWTTTRKGPSFGLIVHHTDGEREYAYDRKPKSTGKLDVGLGLVKTYGWTLVDMKKDWKKVFAFEK